MSFGGKTSASLRTIAGLRSRASGTGVIIPPFLYLPVREGAGTGRYAEMRRIPDGRQALIAFTALDRLADGCGLEQPWIVVQTDALGYLKTEQPFDLVLFDPTFADHLTHEGRLL
ncbi:SAV_915 family protein [Microbacterium sp. 13-71-7]|uniref:SAV_915 family protein n=1 Tax=Microbacterium sp. 13-71-7 TaxID=1970399 RepID=UPI0025D30A94|nr:SAV_915 family protein [Microbacterium sp. 13-71-7]